jgi:outer membrane protein assembly factor BamD (BamD/ComL family)
MSDYLSSFSAQMIRSFSIRRCMSVVILAAVMSCSTSICLAAEDSKPNPLAKATELFKGRKLDQALKAVDEFIAANPKHAEMGNAQTLRGNILLTAVRTRVSKLLAVKGDEHKQAVRKKARIEFESAHASFFIARKMAQAKWTTFPKFIPETMTELRRDRGKAEVDYIRSQLNVASALYETAKIYESTEDAFEVQMKSAAAEYEKIHQRYRSQIGGLYARMWQAQCLQKLGDVHESLGMYNELLGHPGTSNGLVRMQDQARMFRLSVLNHSKRADYELVIIEANNWLAASPMKQRTSTGLGIRWQLAFASEKLSLNSKRSTEQRKPDRGLALKHARYIARLAGRYQDAARVMIKRLDPKPDENSDAEENPVRFYDGYDRSRVLISKLPALRAKIDEANGDEQTTKAKNAYQRHLAKASRLLQLTVRLAGLETDVADSYQARYLLAYVLYNQERSFETVVLCDFIARTAPTRSDQVRLDAAYLSIAAGVKALNAAPQDDRAFEMRLVEQQVNRLVKNWPDSSKAKDAREILKRLRHRPAINVDASPIKK